MVWRQNIFLLSDTSRCSLRQVIYSVNTARHFAPCDLHALLKCQLKRLK